MSLDKSIEYGKEHRKKYKGCKAIDKACRNHGGCDWREGNRKKKYKLKIIDSEQKNKRISGRRYRQI